MAANPATDPFAKADQELVATWLQERYGLITVMVREATPTQAWVRWPFYGWGRLDVKQ